MCTISTNPKCRSSILKPKTSCSTTIEPEKRTRTDLNQNQDRLEPAQLAIECNSCGFISNLQKWRWDLSKHVWIEPPHFGPIWALRLSPCNQNWRLQIVTMLGPHHISKRFVMRFVQPACRMVRVPSDVTTGAHFPTMEGGRGEGEEFVLPQEYILAMRHRNWFLCHRNKIVLRHTRICYCLTRIIPCSMCYKNELLCHMYSFLCPENHFSCRTRN